MSESDIENGRIGLKISNSPRRAEIKIFPNYFFFQKQNKDVRCRRIFHR